MENIDKYPRTYHFPFSPGATSDDKKAPADYWKPWYDKYLVITEKLDGENSCITRDANFARTHSTPASDLWNYNLWMPGGRLDSLRQKIGKNEFVFGENMYAVHSIEYTKLTSDFYVFGAGEMTDDGLKFYSWSDVELMANILDLPTVPVLRKNFKFAREYAQTESQIEFEAKRLESYVLPNYYSGPSELGPVKEGIVVRVMDSFMKDDFSKSVLKYVRKDHVQTDVHWRKNWKKANIEISY